MSTMSLNTNISSLNAHRALTGTQNRLTQSLQRLSTGYRINWAGDDAAGLAVSEKLGASVRSLSQAERNSNDALSVVHTAEGGLQEISNMLVRMRELSVQAASDTLGANERSYLDLEFSSLKTEINHITNTTEFNGQKLIDGTISGTGLNFQVGMRNTAYDQIALNIDNCSASSLGLSSSVGVTTQADAQSCMSIVDSAIDTLSSQRAQLGAVGNRLSSTINNLSISRENLTAAQSRIRDVDVAQETSALARSQVLVQAGVAMLAQANQAPNMMLQLLR